MNGAGKPSLGRRLRPMLGVFILTLPVAMTARGVPDDVQSPWRMITETAQGRLYHRVVEGSSFPEVMIVTRLEAPPSRVRAAVTDYDRFAEFIPNVAESRVLQQEGGRQWVFHRLHFGAPFADRVYVIESSEAASRPRENHYRIEWTLSARRFPALDETGGVNPRALSGFWDLRPLAHGNATEAAYAVHCDPGGFMPGWLVETMTDRYIQQVIVAVRLRIAKDG